MNQPSLGVEAMSDEHDFDCVIPDTGSLTLGEKIGRFTERVDALALTRPARCSIKDQTFSLSAKDRYNTSVDLLRFPVGQVTGVLHRRVSVGKQAKAELLGCTGLGAGLGIVACGILLYKLLNEPGMDRFELGRFLGISLLMITVFAGLGFIVGVINAGAKYAIDNDQIEFQLVSNNDCIVAFRVELAQDERVRRILTNAGWTLRPMILPPMRTESQYGP